MKVALVIPSQAHVYGKMRPPAQMHMGIAYLAGAIIDLCQVSVIDMDAEFLTPEAFAGLMREGRYDLVGVTATTPTFRASVDLARLVKRESPASTVVFGGYHPTLRPDETMAVQEVDIAVLGEGEEALREIVLAKQEGRGFESVPGIFHRSASAVKRTGPRPPRPADGLDRLRFPARKLFARVEYTYPDALYPRVEVMITSRGCPGRCTYCNAHNLFCGQCRFRSAKNVADEMESLVRNGAQEIHIWDDNFATHRQRVFQIRDEILRRGLRVPISFPAGIRADHLDREVLTALRGMGAYSLAVGVESGDQDILDRARKGITLSQVERVFAEAKQSGLETWAFFMCGLPGETPETLSKTLAFAHRLDPDVAKFHILKPYPGSEVYDWLKSNGLLLSEDYDALGIHTPPVHRLESLTPQDMLDWQTHAYRSFYFTPRRLWRQLRRIRTWNRLRLNLKAGLDLGRMIFS